MVFIGAIGSLFLVLREVKKDQEMIEDFMKMQKAKTWELIEDSQMFAITDVRQGFDLHSDYEHFFDQIEIENQDDIKSFLQNTTWRIKETLNSAQQRVENLKERNQLSSRSYKFANLLYFHGDPGIGKSTAFASIIYHLQREKTRRIFQEWFPFFKGYKNFIMIDAKSLLKESSQQKTEAWAQYLRENKYMVVIDDAHKLLGSDKGQTLLDNLRIDQQWVILLASQQPPLKSDYMKNQYDQYTLYELEHLEAVNQIQNCFFNMNNKLAQVTPPLQANYFAYRIWFYLGGNLRKLRKKLFAPNLEYHKKHFVQAYYLAENDKFIEPGSQSYIQTLKTSQFSTAYDYLSQELDIPLEEMVALDFKVIMNLKIPKKNNPNQKESKLDFFQKRNILVQKIIEVTKEGEHKKEQEKKKEEDKEKIWVIDFHSRLTQYAFGMHYLHQEEAHWAEKGNQARVKLQQQLERGEYKYILDYQIFKLQMMLNLKKRAAGPKKEENQAKTEEKKDKPEKQQEDLLVLKDLIKLRKLENEKTILLYEAYQNQRGDKYTRKLQFEPKEIFRDLKKGPRHFYEKVERERRTEEEIEETQKKIEIQKEKLEVLKLRDQIYEQEAAMYLEELEGTKGFKVQNSLAREDFTQTGKEVDQEKVAQALKQIYILLNCYEEQVATTALELAVDAQRRLVRNLKEKQDQPNI